MALGPCALDAAPGREGFAWLWAVGSLARVWRSQTAASVVGVPRDLRDGGPTAGFYGVPVIQETPFF
eukprot:2314634-Pyramimonas_sp.AAC.1